jgi:cytochrome c oxidase subunit 3
MGYDACTHTNHTRIAAVLCRRSSSPRTRSPRSTKRTQSPGAINTAVLLCSSFTMVMAVRAGQLGRRKQIMVFLVLTLILGMAFLGIKGYEWNEKFQEHHIPGPAFHMEGAGLQDHAQLFFSLYFAMTGLHALHMVVGAGLLSLLLYQTYRGRFSAAYYTPIDMVGLYWHFVDIIWIFLFPLLYLIDRHGPKP